MNMIAFIDFEQLHPLSFILALLTFTVLIFYNKTKPLKIDKSMPGPVCHFYLGYLIHKIQKKDDWLNEATRLSKQYGPVWGGTLPKFGGIPGGNIYISDTDSIKYVLNDKFNNFEKGDLWEKTLGEILGGGIFGVDGEAWMIHRKLMSNMFSRNCLRKSASILKEKLFEVVDIFEKKLSMTEDGFEIDIQELFFSLTFDVTSKFIFGISDDIKDTVISKQQEFQKAFDELSDLCQQRFTDPFFRIKRFLNLTRRERRIKQLKRIVDDYAFSVVSATRKNCEMNPSKNAESFDILSEYVRYAQKNSMTMDDSQLKDVVMNIMIAGRDTTACALSWTWYELSKHPDVVKRIIDEVQTVCGTGANANYSFDSMNKLDYTHCVALEVLRLHPPLPINARYAKQNCTLPDGTFVPAGIGIKLLFCTMGCDEKLWSDDALKFRPDRFLSKKEPSAFKLPVFNAGPRTCLGRPLALMNMKLAMSILLTQNFAFKDKNNHPGEYKWSITQSIKGGFPITILKSQEHEHAESSDINI